MIGCGWFKDQGPSLFYLTLYFYAETVAELFYQAFALDYSDEY